MSYWILFWYQVLKGNCFSVGSYDIVCMSVLVFYDFVIVEWWLN